MSRRILTHTVLTEVLNLIRALRDLNCERFESVAISGEQEKAYLIEGGLELMLTNPLPLQLAMLGHISQRPQEL
ncbi:hypothetical protein O7543_18195 [Solwaraspora sp. WMMA2080]|uniref:hypothetical protein n=1 Tax=Solwaraspora sp. WMMA2080 TaxID=3015165 RepID=UPI00248BECB1|nr:hypothetical protein [Solwaraspora sp. WMMA2080]WBC18826.1 hypothetical protein O7543_18195 [Solwaraspora sp. WMMA2080]